MNRTTRKTKQLIPIGEQKRLLAIAETVRARRAYYDEKPDGYLESDVDYFMNNCDEAVELLDLASRIRSKR